MSEINNENCNHDCSNCQANCESREIPKDVPNSQTKIGKVIAVVSGKGGVGKSTVCGLIAKDLNKEGFQVGIMDADITGPSIPKMFDCQTQALAQEDLIIPVETKEGIKVISANLLLADQEAPVIWRGPILAGMVRQFFTDVKWGDLDYLLIDLPPGTADVPLTIFQSLPIDGIVIVTTPQDLVSMIVMKAVNMANMMNIPILGVIENMSYITCPHCNEQIDIFGTSTLAKFTQEKDLVALDRLPIETDLSQKVDQGKFTGADLTVPKTIEAIKKLD